jgi:hypothetical protein
MKSAITPKMSLIYLIGRHEVWDGGITYTFADP